MKLTRPLVAIDIESTGTDPVKDRIVEFAVVVLHPDGARAEWAQRFNPEMPIPPAATAVHGISDADVADCPLFRACAPRIAAGLKGKDLAGYNLRRLDLPMLDEELRRSGMKVDLTGVQVVDCFGIFSKKEPRKLEDAVRRYCHRAHEGAHGALADATATLDVLLGEMKEYPDLDAMPLDQIAAFSQISEQRYADLAGKLYFDADGDVCYAFGKHKDRKVKEEPGYAEWMISRDFPGSTCEVLGTVLEDLYRMVEDYSGTVRP